MKSISLLKWVLIGMISLMLTSCSNAIEPGIVRVENKQFAKKLNHPKYILLDVRTEEEYNQSSIKGAMLINVQDSLLFLQKINELDKKKKVLVYCRSGNRSLKAARLLKENGFKKVFELRGGIKGWDGPVISNKNP